MMEACKIECVTRDDHGAIAALGGIEGDGRPWRLSRGELVQAIETGRMTCYVTLHGQSHLVILRANAAGGKSLLTFLGELDRLPLPACG